VRLKNGEEVKQSTYDEIKGQLVKVITDAFPTVAAVKGFAVKYVNEYFGLWTVATECGQDWVKAYGFEPETSGVLARALLRDLVLRLCYLESCERALRGDAINETELALLQADAPIQVYARIIKEQQQAHDLSLEGLAEKVRVNDAKNLSRLKNGESLPSLKLLRALSGNAARNRWLAGIGFLDVLTRKVGLSGSVVCAECFRAAEVFLALHPKNLSPEWFAKRATEGDFLLLHPGFEKLWPRMPGALWRAHLYNLQFARMHDFAQAYFQYADEENDRALDRFFEVAERESDGCPYGWMDKLKHRNNVLPFPDSGPKAGE
jgi:transcriptional regulator with XRE-family HTH domain